MPKGKSLLFSCAVLFSCSLSLTAAETFDRTAYFGEAVRDANSKLDYVVENAKQNPSKDDFVMIEVKNFSINDSNIGGRIGLVVWDKPDNFAKPGTKPFRAASFPVVELGIGENRMMKFKIGGLTKGTRYSFFAHLDANNDGNVNRNFFGIPTEPYMFTNKDNQGKGPGLTRVGLSAPSFEATLVEYTGPGQVITIGF